MRHVRDEADVFEDPRRLIKEKGHGEIGAFSRDEVEFNTRGGERREMGSACD